jgi:hypothetical protein
MMNGLQSIPQWKNYFNNPTGGKLGLFNAIQVTNVLSLLITSVTLTACLYRLSEFWLGFRSLHMYLMALDVVQLSFLVR